MKFGLTRHIHLISRQLTTTSSGFQQLLQGNYVESPLDCKEIQPVHPKGDQSWVFTGRTDVETETPILWPPHAELTHWKRP